MSTAPIYFTVGPTQLYPTVVAHLKQAIQDRILSISHRSKQFQDIYQNTDTALRKLLNIPSSHHFFFVGSSLESMERTIQNCVKSTSFHFVNGAFSQKFQNIAHSLGKKTYSQVIEFGKGIDSQDIKNNASKSAELICVTHTETSSGACTTPDAIKRLRRLYPDKLIAVDTVSSAPFIDFSISLVDVLFFSVQKGFGLPAGLGVLVVSDRALEKSRKIQKSGLSVGSYHSFESLYEKFRLWQTPETPNVMGIYLLGKVAEDMLKKGIKTMVKEEEKKSKLLTEYFAMSSIGHLLIKKPKHRSRSIIVVETKGNSLEIIEKLKLKGFIVGAGYGEYKSKHIRIANYPAHTLDGVNLLIKKMN